MPVTIKAAHLKYKNEQGEYVGVNSVSDQTTAEQIAAIESAGEDVIDSIPSDYTELSDDVDGLKNALSAISYEEGVSTFNILPYESINTGTIKDVVITRSSDAITLNGTASGTDSITSLNLSLIPSVTYTAKIYTESTKVVNASIRYINSENSEVNLGSFGNPLSQTLTFTAPEQFKRIYLKFGVVRNIVYDNEEYKISIAIGESNTSYVKYGEGHTAFDGYSRNEIEALVLHNKQADTYITPEMFGAIGDGLTNDEAALNSCIEYARTNNKVIRGFKSYRVYSSLVIAGNYLDIYFNQIVNYQSSTNPVIIIMGSRNIIQIDFVSAASMAGVVLTTNDTYNANANQFRFKYIYSLYDALTLKTHDNDDGYLSYNSFYLGTLSSEQGNCVVNGRHATENWFYNATCYCENGWAVYGGGSGKYYSFSMETRVKNGIFLADGFGSTAAFYGTRHAELIQKLVDREAGLRPNVEGGTLIKFGGAYSYIEYIGGTYVPYNAIDITDIWLLDDPRYDDLGPEVWRPKHAKITNCNQMSLIQTQIKWGTYSNRNGAVILGKEMHIIGNKRVCSPQYESSYNVTIADFDMRDSATINNHGVPYPTIFVIDVANCIIHLAPSYCCAGYNKIIIEQTDPLKLCTIYKDGDDITPIFDGTTLGTGIYELTAIYDMSYDTSSILYSDNERVYIPGTDLWKIRKIS